MSAPLDRRLAKLHRRLDPQGRHLMAAVFVPGEGTVVARRVFLDFSQYPDGPNGGDEINIPEAGKNYGWPVITYGLDYSGARIGIGTAIAAAVIAVLPGEAAARTPPARALRSE